MTAWQFAGTKHGRGRTLSHSTSVDSFVYGALIDPSRSCGTTFFRSVSPCRSSPSSPRPILDYFSASASLVIAPSSLFSPQSEWICFFTKTLVSRFLSFIQRQGIFPFSRIFRTIFLSVEFSLEPLLTTSIFFFTVLVNFFFLFSGTINSTRVLNSEFLKIVRIFTRGSLRLMKSRESRDWTICQSHETRQDSSGLQCRASKRFAHSFNGRARSPGLTETDLFRGIISPRSAFSTKLLANA